MSAIYSGIHLKLKNAKFPWEDKIKLAHFAWISQQCFLPNKEQVLLDWVSHSLVGYYSKKIDLKDGVVLKLWSFLDNILHSRKLQSLLKEGKSLNLRFTIAQAINDFIGSSCKQVPQAGISTVLSCCQSILSTPTLAFVYTAKYELMVDLLSKLSTLACLYLSLQEPVTFQIFDVLQMSFNQYIQIQRQQINTNRVFGHVITHLCQPCLLLRHALNSRSWSKEDDVRVRNQLSKDLKTKVETVLQIGLFQSELLSSYKDELLPERDHIEKKKESLKMVLTPVNSLIEKLEDSKFYGSTIHTSVISNSVPLLYKLFLDSYCSDGNHLVCFYMLARLFECLQKNCMQDQENITSSSYNMGLFALEQLLNLVHSHDIYNVAVDRIRHQEVQYNFYRKLAEMLLCNPHAAVPAWFRCLKTLTLLNHQIIEPDLDDLVSGAWIDAEILDTRVKKAQDILIASLFQTYAKLRQFPKLFEEVLTVICRPAIDELRQPVLSPSLTESLSVCLHDLPPNQILEVWTMIFEKYSLILPDIKDDHDLTLKLFSLSSLFHCLLFNMKIMDNSTPVPVILRFQNLMEKTMDHSIKPSLKLIKDHCTKTNLASWIQKHCDATLLLFFTWVEVNTMTILNCSKYTSPLSKSPTPLHSAVEGWDFSLFFEDKDCWKKVLKLTSNSKSFSRYCMGLLTIQKIKTLLMEIRIPTDTELPLLQAASSFVLHPKSEFIISADHVCWNGNASSVNNDNFSVAYWHLIASNLPIIHPYISAEDTSCIADFLLETLLKSEVQADQEATFTIEKVSASLLQSNIFPEMRNLQCTFITCIIKKCACIFQTEQKSFSEILGLLSQNNLMWHTDVFSSKKEGWQPVVNIKCGKSNESSSECLSNMENAAQKILSLSRSDTYGTFSDGAKTDLLGVIELIFQLKPDSLSPSDLTRCFLLLLSLTRADNSPKSPFLMSACCKLMTYLLSGKYSNAIFKLLYASDILQILMSSLLNCNWDLSIDSEKSQEWPEYINIVQSFLERFLAMIIDRKQSVLLNLEKFSSFVINSVPVSDSTDWTSHKGQLLLVALRTLCLVITPLLQEQSANKQRTETLSSLLQSTVLQMGVVVNHCLKISVTSHISPSFLVSCVTTLLEAELNQLSKAGLSAPKNKAELHHVQLYRNFCSQILRELYYAEGRTDFLQSALHYLTVCITVKEIHDFQESIVIQIFGSLKKLLAALWPFSELHTQGLCINPQIIQSFESEITELLTQVLHFCTSDEFYIMMSLVLEGIEVCNIWKNNFKDAFASIVAIRLLLNSPLNGDNGKMFWSTAPHIITALVTLSKEAYKDHLMITSIVVPILEVIALLLRQGEVFSKNPHYVTLSFSILLTVPLEHLKADDYYNVFLGVHEVLYSVLQCHSKAMLKAVPSFLSAFHRLVTSVMHEGRQKGDRASTKEFDVTLNCARLVERMYTHIAAKTEEFTVFSAFIVSHYVNELQKVTLYPAVKKHLAEGIFHILDLCIDRDIKFLNMSLQIGVREVFKDLYNEYIQYHKTKNQGEEKYTA
ncbi:unhealthy ribosome biogenesis protein 2 homolog [Bombina bombina]|uniref:unhealthy ribosome biogenesis protein 2 homolog n=1 Tax=Bombina bombina TaxID=8345 RepID=UPI00235AC397|nr:unhealthy ribosome biogenesis protein 2 homolog [Bombina bombina]